MLGDVRGASARRARPSLSRIRLTQFFTVFSERNSTVTLLGCVARKVLLHAQCSVLIVRRSSA